MFYRAPILRSVFALLPLLNGVYCESQSPNLLIIHTDEQSYKTIGAYRKLLSEDQAFPWGEGVKVDTPHIDSLARDGILFTNFDEEDDTRDCNDPPAMTAIQEMGGTNQGPKTKTQHQNPDDHDDNVTMLDSNHHNGKINDKSQTPTIIKSGYMAMLAVDESYRRSGIGTALVERAVQRMKKRGCRSVTLETEVSNEAAMRLYEDRLGFIREELLVRYYLNWGDAYRLRLWFDL